MGIAAPRLKQARPAARLLFVLFVAALVPMAARAAGVAQKTFASPEDAAGALVQAVTAHDRAATLAVIGDAGGWISSGDAAADRATAERFIAAYAARHAIERNGDEATLRIGEDGFPQQDARDDFLRDARHANDVEK